MSTVSIISSNCANFPFLPAIDDIKFIALCSFGNFFSSEQHVSVNGRVIIILPFLSATPVPHPLWESHSAPGSLFLVCSAMLELRPFSPSCSRRPTSVAG